MKLTQSHYEKATSKSRSKISASLLVTDCRIMSQEPEKSVVERALNSLLRKQSYALLTAG